MPTQGTPAPLPRYWYGASVRQFLATGDLEVLGALTEASSFEITPEQGSAWLEEFAILRAALGEIEGHVYLEFTIPRMGLRADAVLLAAGLVFVLEFKSSAKFEGSALDQVWDYALDLKNFHAASHARTLVPVLVAVAAVGHGPQEIAPADDGVLRPLGCSPQGLRQLVTRLCAELAGPRLDAATWVSANYLPTPSIIEAARALYASHAVEEITRSDAGARNLAVTSRRIRSLMTSCSQHQRKAICFITGVPGAGKTLVGLDLAAPGRDGNPHGVYLSGNGPLVKVLTEALARDEVARCPGKRLGDSRRAARDFIQNVHHYRDEALQTQIAPHEHVAIFDEAQRAWDQPHLADWLKRRKGIPDFRQSESELLIRYLNRHPDWALIVCLVGEEQEINSGEAGIEAWLHSVASHFSDWEVYVPRELPGLTHMSGSRVHVEPELHLNISMRSFRAEAVSGFVQAALACDRGTAREKFKALQDRYPLVVTRDLGCAKAWLRRQARAHERTGLLVSSKAERLRPHAIDVRVKTDPVHWFLDQADDLRSSNFLEAAVTEFDVQGLEVDWACVTWDGDLRQEGEGWSHHRFLGNSWQRIRVPHRQRFQLNAYRVLLTRARQGMVLCVPPGEPSDPTRKPAYYDSTFGYFVSLGVPVLS